MRFLQYTGANKILKTYLLHQCKKDYQMYLKAKKWQNTQEKIDLRIKKKILWEDTKIFDRSTCSKRSKESLFSVKKLPSAIHSILAYFTMFSFRVLTCLRIVSIRIILILNKFKHAWESYQLISYWLWTSLDMFENRNNSYHIESEQV
jgi:hypothetical protein